MGDAFRGLTIKLGADARPLKSAIDSIKSSARDAQTQLRAMDKALNFDSGDVKAMASRIDLVGDKSLLAARSAMKIRTAMQQAANETIQFSEKSGLGNRRLADMAARTRDVYSATEKLRSEYNNVDTQLAHIYERIAKVYQEQNKVDGKKMEFEDALKEVKKLANGMENAADKARQLRSLVNNKSGFQNVNDDIFGFTGSARKRANDAWNMLKRLRNEQKALQNDLEAMHKVEGYSAMKTQLIAYEAELRQAASEAARFKSELYATGATSGIAKALSSVREIDSALDKARMSANAMSDAFKAAPTSLEAAKAKMASLKNEEDLLHQKAIAYKRALESFSAVKGFDRQRALTSNVYSELSKATNKARELDVQYKQASAAVEEVADRMRIAAERSGKGSDEVKKLASEYKRVKAELAEIAALAGAADESLRLASAEKGAREAYEGLVKVNSELTKIKSQSSSLSRVGEIAGTLRTMGYGLYSTVTPAILMAGRYAIDAAEEIDSSWRDMRKTVNGSEEDFKHLKDAALEFSGTHVTSASTILEIEAMGGQLGIAVENLEAFSKVVSNLDIATDIEAEDMAKYIGQLSNIMDDIHQTNPSQYEKDITHFSDALVRLGNNSAAQESSIMKVMMRIASLGNISGFTTPQLLAISTAVAATGQGCEAAGTAISKTFSNIQAAVSNGGDTLEGFAKVSGMSAQEFAQAWSKDPMKAFDAFIGGLRKIKDEGGDVDGTLMKLKISSVRQKQALEGLASTYDVMTQAIGMANTAWNGVEYKLASGKIELAGDAAREAQRKSEGFSGELQMMRNNAEKLAASLASGALPIIEWLGDKFKELTNIVDNMSPTLKTALVGLMGIGAISGPILVAVGAIAAAARSVRQLKAEAAGFKLWNALTSGSETALNTGALFRDSIKKTSLAIEQNKAALEKNNASLAEVRARQAECASATEKTNPVLAAQERAIEKNKAALEKNNATLAKVRANQAAYESATGKTNPVLAAQERAIEKNNAVLEKSNASLAKVRANQAAYSSAMGKTNSILATREKALEKDNAAIAKNISAQQKSLNKMSAASSAVRGIGSAMKMLGGFVAFDLALTGLDALISHFETSAKRTRNLTDATEGLSAVTKSLPGVLDLSSRAMEGASKSSGGYKRGVEEVTAATDQLVEDQANLASSIRDSFKDTETNAAKAQFYADKILELAGACEGSPEKLAELKDAIANFNELTGSDIRIVDETTGALDRQSDAIRRNADAYKYAAYAKAAAEAESALLSSKIKAEQEYADSYARLGDAIKNLGGIEDSFNDIDQAQNAAYMGMTRWNDINFQKAAHDVEELKNDVERNGLTAQFAADAYVHAHEMAILYQKAAEGNREAMAKLRWSLSDYGIALTDAGRSSTELIDAMQGIADDSQVFATMLSEAGISAKQFAELGSEGFRNLYHAAGDSMNGIAEALALLNAAGIDPKTMVVTEEGIEDASGKLWKLDADANTITDGEHVFKITAQGVVDVTDMTNDAINALGEYDGSEANATLGLDDEDAANTLDKYENMDDIDIHGTVTVEGDADEVTAKLENLEQFEIAPKDFTISSNSEEIKGELDDLNEYEFRPKSISVNVIGNARWALDDIASTLYNLHDKEVTVRVNRVSSFLGDLFGWATGSIFPESIIRAIPRHADGGINGIVTGPMLTNVGLVGEAGDEAILHMKNAGGAIIPLSNRQHVRPFAQAVAAEMGGFSQPRGGDTYNITVHASGDGDEIARSVTRAIRAQNLMKGRR